MTIDRSSQLPSQQKEAKGRVMGNGVLRSQRFPNVRTTSQQGPIFDTGI